MTDRQQFTIRVRGRWSEDYMLTPWWRVTARRWYRNARRNGYDPIAAKGLVADDLRSSAWGEEKTL